MTDRPADERFTQIYQQAYPLVLAYCARRVSATEAEAAASEVFGLLWQKIEVIDTDRALPWLYGVARRTLAHHWRSRDRWLRLVERVGGSEGAWHDSTEELVLRREQDRLVIDSLSQLRPADQEILRLSAWEGLTAAECAQVLGCSVTAAEQRLHRAKQRLAARLGIQLSPSPARATTQEEPS